MKTATVHELRNDFGKVSAWLESGETVCVMKRGRPFARVVPEPHIQSLLGCMAGTAVVPPDLEETVPVLPSVP
jgi:antitoxin (DNA-binding transcriptional repressor) of toxin-antitoxin stability system